MGHPIPEDFYCSRVEEEKTNKNKLIKMNTAGSSSSRFAPQLSFFLPTASHSFFFYRSKSALEIPSFGSHISTAHSTVTVEDSAVDKAPTASQLPAPTNSMPQKGTHLSLDLQRRPDKSTQPQSYVPKQTTGPLLEWDWDVEHEDRKQERKADASLRGAAPFEVDRRVLKDVVRERMGVEVGRIKFMSAGKPYRALRPLLPVR